MQPSHGVALGAGLLTGPKILAALTTLLTGAWGLNADRASAASYLIFCIILAVCAIVWWFASGKPKLPSVLNVLGNNSNNPPAPPTTGT